MPKRVLMHFTINLPPVTKKNHQRILKTVSGRPFIAPSQQYAAYAKCAGWFLNPRPAAPIDTPVNVRCVYYLAADRKTDLSNLIEATHDVLVENGVLADDNHRIIKAVDGSRVYVDKNRPRTEIYIEEMYEDEEEDTL